MYQKKTITLDGCIKHTASSANIPRDIATALFYNETSGELPIGFSIARNTSDTHFLVTFQPSPDAQCSE